MSAHAKPEPPDLLTIDDLARAVGMTVRNLREWRTLGLVPPAEVHGRVGYYEPGVVRRIERIKELHAEGFPLELIRRLVEAAGDSEGEIMRLAHTLRAPFRDDEPPPFDPDEWAAQWGKVRERDLKRAQKLGLLRRRPDGELEYTSARIAAVGPALHELGLTLDQVLDITAQIRAHADGLAELFERVWLEHIWQPFLDAGMPEEQLAGMPDTARTVQPLALDAVVALFTVAMEQRIEQSVARQVEHAMRRFPG
jgi:DNA-binding transcriptional MerR regulator